MAPGTEAQNGPSNVVDAISKPKEPPPETPKDIWTRRYVVLSFWLMVFLLGVPYWWRTTTVYRAELPLQAMDDWAEGRVCDLVFPLEVALHCPTLPLPETEALAQSTEAHLHELSDLPVHYIHVRAGTTNDTKSDAALKVQVTLREDIREPELKLRSSYLEALYNPRQKDPSLSLSLAKRINDLFAEERAMIAYLNPTVGDHLGSKSPTRAVLSSLENEFDRRRTRSVMYSSTYHITFSLLTPGAYPSSWEIENILSETVKPLLQGLSLMYNFTVDTQVQPYSALSTSVQPFYDESRRAWILQRSDLHGFVNAAEWPLNPSIRPGPTINFVLFVPPSSMSPLIVEDHKSNSWLIPQWGSVLVYNRPSQEDLEKTRSLSASELIGPFRVFSQNLVALLGLPSADQPVLFRIRSQMRLLCLRLIFNAASTLGSTARLTQSLPSISIPENVASAVDATILHLHTACQDMQAGRFSEALRNAKAAEGTSDRAFFDKSMVGQAYFPEEHKVAVYLPMLGPVAVPLLMSAIKELRSLKKCLRPNT